MASTRRENILAAILTVLQGITGVSGLTVQRNRVDDVASFPMIVLRDGGHAMSREATVYDMGELTATVELYVRAASASEDVGTLLNVLYGKVKTAVTADKTLGGLATDLYEREMSEPDFDRGDSLHGQAAALVTFTVDFWIPRDNPA